jgi:hypothetical protein
MNKQQFFESYGPWAVVTGASSGIGEAFAKELAGRGLNILLVARTKSKLDETAGQLQAKYGVQTGVIVADLGEKAGVEAVLERIKKHDIGFYVGAAGFGTSGPFVDLSVSEEMEMIQVNCSAAVEITHSVANQMRSRGRGGIVLFASLVGWQGVPLSATYSATKAFIQSFAEAIRVELKPSKIDVLSVAPGPVLSGFDTRANMKIERGVTPEQVASESLRALGKKTTVVPGSLSKILTYSLFTAPRSLRVQIMRPIMAGLSNHGKRSNATNG